jgi:serine/threonine protein kinase
MCGDLPAGSSFGDYRIERLIARGGMGTVYLAREHDTDRAVALKLVRSELVDDEHFRARFERESRLTAQMDHPNVVALYGSGEVDGVLYVATRFIEGSDLEAVIAHHGKLHPRHAAAITRPVAAALDAAHERGLIHRDVKPANVLIDEHDGAINVYLADFGLSKSIASRSGLTRTGTWVGTIDYAAPEQIRAETSTIATDVYALGCVLYEMLAGDVPYPRARDVDKLAAHAAEMPALLSETVPGEFNEIIAHALAKDPAQRYRSAGALAEAALAAAERSGRPPHGTLIPGAARGDASVDRGAPTAG